MTSKGFWTGVIILILLQISVFLCGYGMSEAGTVLTKLSCTICATSCAFIAFLIAAVIGQEIN